MDTRKQAHPAQHYLAAFALGKLTPDGHAKMQKHLAACKECSSFILHTPHDSLIAIMKSANPSRAAEQATSHIRESETLIGGVRNLKATGKLSVDSESRPDGIVASKFAVTAPYEDIPEMLRQQTKYRVVRLLGRGGMGAVYEAYHERMDRQVAIKVISPTIINKPDVVERFDQEIRAAAKLDHPNVARAYDADAFGSLRVLVMEFVPGQSLDALIAKKGPLSVVQTCRVMEQTLLGLQHAYERSMVHRDLKPQNLMMTPDGRIKILDFGLAKLASEHGTIGGLTREHALMGTPHYLAPEQALDAARADIRADIYSLGCTLYCLLTGAPPFNADTEMKVLQLHQYESPPPLQRLRADIPHELSEIASWMLAKDPASRPQVPGQLAQTFAALEQNLESSNVMRPMAQNFAMPATVPSVAAPVIESKASGSAHSGTILPFNPADVDYQTPLRRGTRPAGRSPGGIAMHLGGSLVGLTIGAAVLGFLKPEFDVLGLFHEPQAIKEEQKPKTLPVREAAAAVRREQDVQRPRRRDDHENKSVQQQPEQRSEPEQERSAPSTVPVFEVSDQVDLPDLTGGASVKLATISTDELTVGLHNPDANPRKFQVKADDDKKKWLIMQDEKQVAEISRQDTDLQFTWAANVTPDTECLRNTLLTFHAWDKEKTSTLRSTKVDTLSTVDMDKTNMMILPLDVELWGLKSSALQFELGGITSAVPIAKYEPETRKVVANKKIRAFVRDEWPFASLDISLNSSGTKVSMRVEPRMEIDGNEVRWTVDSINRVVKQLSQWIKEAKADDIALKKDIPNLQKTIAQLQTITIRDVRYQPAQERLAVFEPQLIVWQTRYAEIQQQLPTREAHFKALTRLAEIGNQVNKKAKLAYRVFYTVAGREVDVYRAE